MKKKIIERYKKEIDRLKEEIEQKKYEVENFEIDVDKYERMFKEYIDSDLYEGKPIVILGIQFDPSKILHDMDEISYNAELHNFVDGVDLQNDPKYIELNEDLNDLEAELEEYELDLEAIENEKE